MVTVAPYAARGCGAFLLPLNCASVMKLHALKFAQSPFTCVARHTRRGDHFCSAQINAGIKAFIKSFTVFLAQTIAYTISINLSHKMVKVLPFFWPTKILLFCAQETLKEKLIL